MKISYSVRINFPNSSGTWYDADFVGCQARNLRFGGAPSMR